MTQIKDPISQISQLEKEAKKEIEKAEIVSKNEIKQTEAKRDEKITEAQGEALEKARDMIKLAKNEIEKHKDDNKKALEEQLSKITQNAKNNFSKVSSLVTKAI